MTRIELAREVSKQAPSRCAWAADIYDGDTELLMPPPFHKFTVAGIVYHWFTSSHHIRGTSMSMSNQLILCDSSGLVAKFSMGVVGGERKAISSALCAIRKRLVFGELQVVDSGARAQ